MPSTEEPDLTRLQLDAAALRVLAHPLRSRLLSALRRGGPATATDLADALDTNTGATSYHLRKLESVGLVTDTGEGAGRRRLWRAATDSHQWNASDFVGDKDSEAALSWLVRDYSRHLGRHVEQWLDVEGSWPTRWRDAAGTSDYIVLVTPDQAETLKAEVDRLVSRYRHAGEGHPEAKTLAVYSVVVPMDLDDPPEPVAR